MSEAVRQSNKLQDVLYSIRGPVLDAATALEHEGHRITKLNIGNPAPFGFAAPDEVLVDMTGMGDEAYRAMMLAGGRSPEGNRYQHEWDDKEGEE